MTEAEWLSSDDPKAMLEYLRSRTSERKLRLFACGCARLLWQRFAQGRVPDPRSKTAVELAEAFLEGCASAEDLRMAVAPTNEAAIADASASLMGFGSPDDYPVYAAALYAQTAVAEALVDELVDSGIYCIIDFLAKAGPEVAVLREVFGNPFRPVALDAHWLTSLVVDLSRAIYKERAFEGMPILADALEDADCNNADILTHCRGSDPHLRGCWVIDLVLGLK
jgi:hypothetical protein